MPSRAVADLIPELRPLCEEFLRRCESEGIPAVLTCTLRSDQEQAALYAAGRTAPGRIVTNAKPGQSKHNSGHAFDIGLRKTDGSFDWDDHNPHWLRMGEIGEALGLKWGGRFSHPDKPHFELP